MADLIIMYQGELEAHPAITQVLTMATLLLAGDVVSQTFFQKKPFDTRQTANFFIVGVFYTGPCSVAWFGLVERFVVMDGAAAAVIKVLAGQVIYTPPYTLGLLVLYGLLKGQGWKEVLDSVLAGQLIFSPLFTLGILVFYGLLRGQCWMDIMKSVRTKYAALMISRYMVYPV
ncbi:unnamed protein product, partial [Ixodes pacificus]